MQNLNPFDSIISDFQGEIRENIKLSGLTYYRIGGPARFVAAPKVEEDLALLGSVIQKTGMPFFILGWGSNLLFPDAGWPGLIIRMKNLGVKAEVSKPGELQVGASMGASSLLRQAAREGWDGLQHWVGIPGSMGGLVAMNAGTKSGETKDIVTSVRVVNLLTGQDRMHVPSASSFSYRHNHFLNSSDVVTRVSLRFQPVDPAYVAKVIEECLMVRKSNQPVDLPSCGSVFMNPVQNGDSPYKQAWQVIEKVGLRGHAIGGARFSTKHCNFIVNEGAATASDVLALMDLAKQRARTDLGIDLMPEVKVVMVPKVTS